MSDVTDVHAAIGRGDWETAYALASRSDIEGDRAELLELAAMAAYGHGELEAAVQSWEDLYAHELAAGNTAGAARAGAMVAMFLMMDTGLMSTVRGWLRAAERLVDGAEPTPAHALIAMTRTYERFMCGDMEAAGELAAAAVHLGSVTGTEPAVMIGRVASARVRIYDGDLDAGLRQLEEVGAHLMAGRADALTTGMMYCELICAAQGLGLHDMAREWTEVMEGWRHGAAFGGIHGRCRVHRAEIMRVTGPCGAAEAEALGACAELRPWMRREYGWPLAELGNIRLRRGDLAGAEAAFMEAHQHAWSPQPGLALVRLAQGDAAGAAAMIADAIEHPSNIPSKERPPFGELRLAPLLDAQAEIAFARDDAETCRAAASRLAAIAERFPGPFLQGWALLASGRAALVAQDPDTSAEHCRAAVATWVDVGAPYEAASARLVLGLACTEAGNADSAELEWRAAEATFRDFGAERRAADAAGLLQGIAAPSGPSVSPERPRDGRTVPNSLMVHFVAEGTQRRIRFAGATTVVKDLKGFRYVERMAREPGREFHVLDLVAAETGVLRPAARSAEGMPMSRAGDSGLPVLDDAARDAYRRRLAEVERDIDEAREANDLGRIELAERDRDYLVAELTRAVGLGGRARSTGSSAERARTAVARSIRYALAQLAEAQPDLATRLRTNIRTGTYCVYEPDTLTPLTWSFTDRPPPEAE